MDQVIPGLWIGDLPSAKNTELLKAHGICSILSAMRGRFRIKETFIRHQILLDDTQDEDVLVHLLPSIHFIQEELDKGRSVLVHCQAGISRSCIIVAAYLMYSQDLDTDSALKLIRQVRPYVKPNENFLHQLEIFHQSQYKLSRKDKAIRMYYMERTAQEILNGDENQIETDMFTKVQETPGGPRRSARTTKSPKTVAPAVPTMSKPASLTSKIPAIKTAAPVVPKPMPVYHRNKQFKMPQSRSVILQADRPQEEDEVVVKTCIETQPNCTHDPEDFEQDHDQEPEQELGPGEREHDHEVEPQELKLDHKTVEHECDNDEQEPEQCATSLPLVDKEAVDTTEVPVAGPSTTTIGTTNQLSIKGGTNAKSRTLEQKTGKQGGAKRGVDESSRERTRKKKRMEAEGRGGERIRADEGS